MRFRVKKVVVVTALIAFVLVSKMAVNRDEWGSTPYRHNVTVPAFISSHTITVSTIKRQTDFVQALAARADADRYIMLVMTDEAFSKMAINFYQASLRAHNVNNFLFVGLGRRTCEIMTTMSIPCFYYTDVTSAGKASDYGNTEFNRKVNLRTNMILDAITANFTVINTDTDVAFLGNPLQHLKVNDSSVNAVALM